MAEKQVVSVTTEGTICTIVKEFFVALDRKGHLYYLPKKGKGQNQVDLPLGSQVLVYHSEGPYPEVFTYEPL